MFLHLLLNMYVSNVLDILFLKSNKAHCEDVTPGSREAVQCLHLQAPSFLWPLNTEEPSGRTVRSCGP